MGSGMKRRTIYIYTFLATLYIAASYVYPLDHAALERRHLDLIVARIVSISVATLFIAVWYLAAYASAKFRSYTMSIRSYRDGPALLSVASGVQLLAIYLPVRSVMKAVLNYEAFIHPSFASFATIVITYVSLALPFAAFILIGRGCQRLENVAKARISLPEVYALGLAFILLAVWYCYASFMHAGNVLPANWLVTAPADVPIAVRTFTIIIPYLFMWFVGCIAVYEVMLYQRYVKGVIYRKALESLSLGIALLIAMSIISQFAAVNARGLQAMPFGIVLVITYGVLLLLGLAFGFIVRGVRKLWLLDHI